VQRDPIYAALTAQLAVLTQAPNPVAAVVSRGFVPWEAADAQPAIYIVPVQEEAIPQRGLPNKYLIHLDLYLYVRWTDSVAQGVTALAQLQDQVDAIISPVGPNAGIDGDNGFVNTLGGLVVYCALKGAADISGGFLNKSQAAARMPVEIMVA
jgi:hypothetical protein